MIEPEHPDNEYERLRMLRSIELLDTPPEERYDRITRLAKHLFDVPIALVSIVDEDRQWFKSIQGLPVSETPRNISFCGHTILTDDPLIVPNAKQDIRFATNPLVEDDPSIRFYAGYPLSFKDGVKVGTLCIIDSEPRDFTKEDEKALADLAKTVESEIRRAHLHTLDELTHFANASGFLRIGRHTLDAAKRMNHPMALFKFTMTNLKEIEHDLNKESAQEAIKRFADALCENCRAKDILSCTEQRVFYALCPNADEKQLKKFEKELKKTVHQMNKQNVSQTPIEWSIQSIHDTPASFESFEAMLDHVESQNHRSGQPTSFWPWR